MELLHERCTISIPSEENDTDDNTDTDNDNHDTTEQIARTVLNSHLQYHAASQCETTPPTSRRSSSIVIRVFQSILQYVQPPPLLLLDNNDDDNDDTSYFYTTANPSRRTTTSTSSIRKRSSHTPSSCSLNANAHVSRTSALTCDIIPHHLQQEEVLLPPPRGFRGSSSSCSAVPPPATNLLLLRTKISKGSGLLSSSSNNGSKLFETFPPCLKHVWWAHDRFQAQPSLLHDLYQANTSHEINDILHSCFLRNDNIFGDTTEVVVVSIPRCGHFPILFALDKLLFPDAQGPFELRVNVRRLFHTYDRQFFPPLGFKVVFVIRNPAAIRRSWQRLVDDVSLHCGASHVENDNDNDDNEEEEEEEAYIAHVLKMARQFPHTVLVVVYEDYIRRPENTVLQLRKFLKIRSSVKFVPEPAWKEEDPLVLTDWDEKAWEAVVTSVRPFCFPNYEALVLHQQKSGRFTDAPIAAPLSKTNFFESNQHHNWGLVRFDQNEKEEETTTSRKSMIFKRKSFRKLVSGGGSDVERKEEDTPPIARKKTSTESSPEKASLSSKSSSSVLKLVRFFESKANSKN